MSNFKHREPNFLSLAFLFYLVLSVLDWMMSGILIKETFKRLTSSRNIFMDIFGFLLPLEQLIYNFYRYNEYVFLETCNLINMILNCNNLWMFYTYSLVFCKKERKRKNIPFSSSFCIFFLQAGHHVDSTLPLSNSKVFRMVLSTLWTQGFE